MKRDVYRAHYIEETTLTFPSPFWKRDRVKEKAGEEDG